jgi:hypothetical protein
VGSIFYFTIPLVGGADSSPVHLLHQSRNIS